MWALGVSRLCTRYGLSNRNMFISGTSGAGQFAARLVLAKPDFFSAVYVHIPSSFDRPRESAKKVFWCLTTGEEEAGYERSLHFYMECRKLGYQMIYKAIPGLGHAGHPIASRLEIAFFEHVYKNHLNGQQNQVSRGEMNMFWRMPPYYGDLFRQQVYMASDKENVPPAILIPLPSREIATAWEEK